MKIPNYYRQFQTQPVKGNKESSEIQTVKEPKIRQDRMQDRPDASLDKTVMFQGNGFSLNLLEDWEDKTIYTITGPVTDGVQHNAIITKDEENLFGSLEQYAQWHIKTLETELKSCSLLKKGETRLANGNEAYEAIFSWYPTNELRIYQHQIFT